MSIRFPFKTFKWGDIISISIIYTKEKTYEYIEKSVFDAVRARP